MRESDYPGLILMRVSMKLMLESSMCSCSCSGTHVLNAGQIGHFGVVTLDGRCQLITQDPTQAFMDLTYKSRMRTCSCSGQLCQLREADEGFRGPWYEALDSELGPGVVLAPSLHGFWAC